MLRPLPSALTRPSVIWSISLHLAAGAALWGSGLISLPLQEALGEPLVVGVQVACPEDVDFPEALSPELETLDEAEFPDSDRWPDSSLLDPLPSADADLPDPFDHFLPLGTLQARAIEAAALPRRRPQRAVAEPPIELAANEPFLEPVSLSKVALLGSPEAILLEPEELTDSCPPPVYPRSAVRRRLQGTVVLSILVGADGRVANAIVSASSGHAILDDAARDAVLAWRYQPASQGGVALERRIAKSIEFRIPG